jgi:hypothetical protein
MLLKGNIVEFYLKQKACKALLKRVLKSAPNSTLFMRVISSAHF